MEDNIEGYSRESPSRRGVLGASQEILGRTSTPSGRTPPQSSTNPASKSKLRINGNWISKTLEQALDAITDHVMKIRTASRHFGIPATSLRNHLYGLVTTRQRRSHAVLKQEEEHKLVQYLFKIQDLGHPLIPWQLRLKVALATQTRETPWSVVGIPGRSWLRSFKQRHPEVSSRKSQGLEIGHARGLCVPPVLLVYTATWSNCILPSPILPAIFGTMMKVESRLGEVVEPLY
jgi:hypothetical protein